MENTRRKLVQSASVHGPTGVQRFSEAGPLAPRFFRCIIPVNSILDGEPWALRKLQICGFQCVASV